MQRWRAEYAWTGTGPVVRDVVIEAVDGVITAVTPNAGAVPMDVHAGAGAGADAATPLPGLTMPGFANAHSHAFHRALRGRTHGGTGAGDFWAWRDQMYRAAERLDPDRYHALATACYAEMALAGITTVGEFHYLHHDPAGRAYADANVFADALVAAARAAGVRLTLLDTCYLRAGLAGEALAPVQRRYSDGSVDAWAERVDDLRHRYRDAPDVVIGVAAHSVRALEREELGDVAAFAQAHDLPFHIHLSEQPAENEACRAATGLSPTALLAAIGALTPATTVVHATHLTPDDISVLGTARSAACFCPTTERDLADGIGPAHALTDAGSPLCLGSDSQAVIDLLEEARAVELNERLASRRRGTHRPEALLHAATANGQAALGWPLAAASGLAAGAPADFVTVALGSVRLAGSDQSDLLGAVTFAATAADVSDVVVGGRPIVRDGRHLLVDDVAGALRSSIDALWSA